MAKKEDKTAEVTEVAQDSPKATIAMKRVLLAGQSGPTTADVHPNEVDHMRQHGWHLNTE